jgi:hypothetical protein
MLLAACPSKEGERQPVAAHRLKAIYLDGGGGARIFQGWFDQELETECRFEVGSDEIYRCLPGRRGGGLVVGSIGGSGIPEGDFLDEDCTEPITVVSCGFDQGRFVRDPTPFAPSCDSIGGRDPIIRGRTGREVKVGEYFTKVSGVCMRVSGGDNTTYAELSAPIPEGRFVRAQRSFEIKSARFGVWVLTGEDGSREELEIVDRSRNVECYPAVGGYCVPGGDRTVYVSSSTSAFAEDCTTPIVLAPLNPCRAAEVVALATSTGTTTCVATSQVFQVGRFVPMSEVRTRDSEGRCAAPEQASSAGITLGEPADIGALTTKRIGDGPIVAEVYATEDGAEIFEHAPVGFFDRATGVACSMVPTDDRDVMLCSPRASIAIGSIDFSDAACTQPVTSVNSLGPCHRPEIAVRTIRSVRADCSVSVANEVRPILGPVAGPAHLQFGTMCQEIPPGFGGRNLHALGEPMDISAWHKITRVVE